MNTPPPDRSKAAEIAEQKLPYPARQSEMRQPPQSDLSAYRAAGKLDGKRALITGADSGIGFEDISEEQFRRTFETNIFGYFHLTQAALPHLKEGSAIINTGGRRCPAGCRPRATTARPRSIRNNVFLRLPALTGRWLTGKRLTQSYGRHRTRDQRQESAMKMVSALATALLVAASASTEAKDIVESAKASGQFSILLKAAAAAGMDTMLTQPGPFTVFAPTDAAFNALPPGTVEMLMKPENKDMLKKVIGYHTLFGRLATQDLKDDKSSANTAAGAPVVLEKKGGSVMVNEAKIVQPDMAVDNGVIHVIDKVLMPAKPVQPKT